MLELAIQNAFDQALSLAGSFAGQTSPNPCVGAVALDRQGKVLSVQAHERAGQPHAEARVIQDLESRGLTSEAHTLVVTLEPCNHHGRTPPCTEAVIRAGFKRVFFGALDPNPRVEGGGATRLQKAGIEVIGPTEILALDSTSPIPSRCQELIRSFVTWAKTGRPWVTLKTAINSEGTMLPPSGQKTFTSPESLRLAHALRKRADAILTGSGTILADQPDFTVRHLPDHPGKQRWLVVMDRRGRVSDSYFNTARSNGFQVHVSRDLEEALQFLGSQGVIEVLAECGPALTQAILDGGFWNQHVLIQHQPGTMDQIEVRFR